MFYTIVSVSLKMSAGPRLVTLGAGNSNTADIKTALKEDRKAGTFTDVVIACKDRETVSIHKLLLVATSKFLADILSNIDYYEEPPVLILPDFETTIIVRLVAAMYGDFDEELDWNWDLEGAIKTLGLNASNASCNEIMNQVFEPNIILTLT